MPDLLDAPPPIALAGQKTRITAETAAAFHALARAKRRKAAEPAPKPTEPPPPPPDPWIANKLAEVRSRIDTVSSALADALTPRRACEHCGQVPLADPLDVERLSRALAALADWERRLAGRPDPGSFRPEAPRTRKPKVEQVLGD